MDYIKLIDKYYGGAPELRHILVTHSRQVADRALSIIDRHPEWSVDRQFVEEAAMLHDIGIIFCDAPKIFKEDCEIKFAEKTAAEVKNVVRGLSPYHAAWANLTMNGQTFENVKIYAVEIVENGHVKSEREIIVPCKEGAVRILELQVPGKKRMEAKAFLNGLH